MDFALPPLEIALDDDPPARDLQSVLHGLLSYNQPLEPESRHTPFAVFARTDAGQICAGLTGARYFNACFVDYLWVDAPLRGRGVGRTLLETAEQMAAADGRDLVHLESMSFQAPGFYGALGYDAYARLEGYLEGAARIHFRRTLGQSVAETALRNAPIEQVGLHLDTTTAPDAEDLRVVRKGLFAWNAQVYRPDNPRPLNVFLRGPGGQVWGGLTASTYWNACFVDLFWVDSGLRRKGFGTAVMQAAEDEAARRGCDFVHLDTFNFQARAFYEKLGFRVYGTLPGFPDAVERYHLVKQLHSA